MLFKRLLLTLFPEPEWDLQFNPATFFINFVSAKQFFTVILRKIVENYKLYFYDINFDPFEVKIWFWETPTIRLSEVEKYFSYISVAEMNWYRFFSPVVVSTALGFVAAYKTGDIFKKYKDFKLYINFVLSVVLLYYVFLARIKKVTHLPKKQAFNHFLDIFFNFYKFVNEYNDLKVDNNFYEEIKNKLLKEKIDLFFAIFYVYAKAERIFFLHNVGMKDKEFFEWLFYDESKVGKYKNIIKDYLDNYEYYQKEPTFSTTEKMILNLIFPSDVLIRFFLDWPECFEIVNSVLWEIFKDWKLDNILKDFLDIEKWEDNVYKFLEYITDYKVYKNGYFKGVKKFIFKALNVKSKSISEEYIEDLLSSFSPDMKLPPEVKREGMLAERLVNFYLSFIWSFWIWRWDTGYFRIYKKFILEDIISSLETNFNWDTFYFIGWLLYLYWKNVFYYQYAFESIKSGKQTFRLPTRPLYKEIYSSPALIHFLNESAFINLIEDLNYKDIKLYVRHSKIIDNFKNMFWESISKVLKSESDEILDFFYKDIFDLLDLNDKYIWFKEDILESEIKFLKNNLYSLDFWIFKDVINEFIANKKLIKSELTNIILLHVLAILRQTIFGLLILYTYFKEEKKEKNIRLDDLLKIYYSEVLLLSFDEKLYDFFSKLFNNLLKKYEYFLKIFIKLDDNKEFLKILFENWTEFIDGFKENEEILWFIKWEDVVWFRWVLKNITFYNKRYFIPSL